MLQFCFDYSHPLVTTSRGQELQKQKEEHKQANKNITDWLSNIPAQQTLTGQGFCLGFHQSNVSVVEDAAIKPIHWGAYFQSIPQWGKGSLLSTGGSRVAFLSWTLTSLCPTPLSNILSENNDPSNSLRASLFISLHQSGFLLNSPYTNTNQGGFPRLVL